MLKPPASSQAKPLHVSYIAMQLLDCSIWSECRTPRQKGPMPREFVVEVGRSMLQVRLAGAALAACTLRALGCGRTACAHAVNTACVLSASRRWRRCTALASCTGTSRLRTRALLSRPATMWCSSTLASHARRLVSGRGLRACGALHARQPCVCACTNLACSVLAHARRPLQLCQVRPLHCQLCGHAQLQLARLAAEPAPVSKVSARGS